MADVLVRAGLSSERSSTRLHAPPGGQCNDIFGTGDAPAVASPARKGGRKVDPNAGSQIFGAPVPTTASDEPKRTSLMDKKKAQWAAEREAMGGDSSGNGFR